jgi:gliding motility-associated-like protein
MKNKSVFFLILCLYTSFSFSQGGDNAASASIVPITLPFSAQGTTVGKLNDYNLTTTMGLTAGNDWLYYVCATSSTTININLDFPITSAGIYPSITVWDGIPGSSLQVSGHWIPGVVGPGAIGTSFTPTTGQCYYIVIDNISNNVSNIYDFPYTLTVSYSPPPLTTQPACTNIGFEDGNFNGWQGAYGYSVKKGNITDPMPFFTPTTYNTNSNQTVITSSGNDPLAGFPTVCPGMGANSVRLGDGAIGGIGGATLEQKFSVTSSNSLYTYYYAFVINSGNSHSANEQPYFKIELFDSNGDTIPCGQYLVVGGLNSGLTQIGTTYKFYKNWTPISLDLSSYIGSSVTIKYTVADCSHGAHYCYAYLDGVCGPMSIIGDNQICAGETTTLNAPTGFTSYAWSVVGSSTVLGTNQSFVATPLNSTTYQCVLTSVSGCNKILTYTVNTSPKPILTAISATICQGQSATITTSVSPSGGTYSWTNGAGTASSFTLSPSTTSTYLATYTSIDGCTDTALATITVNPLPIVSINNPSICAGNNATITASPNISGTYNYAWTVPVGAISPGNVSSFSTSFPGTYSVIITNSVTGCSSNSASGIVTNNPLPFVTVNSPTICSGQSTSINATISPTGNYNYAWTVPNNFSAPGNVSNFQTTIAGTYSVIVTDVSTGCSSNSSSGFLNVNPAPNATINNSTICEGSSAIISVVVLGSGNYSYTWNVPSGVLPPGNVSQLSSSIAGNYSVIVTDQSNLCSSPIKTGVITVIQTPSVMFSALATTICSGNSTSINFNGTPNAVVNYKVNSGNIQTIVLNSQGIGSISTGNLTISTNYELVDVTTSISPFCSQALSSSILITVESSPVISFTSDITKGCAPLKVQFTNSSSNSSDCIWDFGDGVKSSGCGTISHTFYSPGCYDISLASKSQYGCVGNLKIPSFVCVEANPKAAFNPTPDVLSGLNTISIMENISSGAVNYQWSFGDGSVSSEVNPEHNYSINDGVENYTIQLIAKSDFGCVDTAIVTIRVIEELIYFIPNAFTPDGDKLNQTFQPVFTKGYDPFSYNMVIMNRWGEIIFESNDAKVGWDGTYGGTIVQDGVYTWRISFKLKSTDEHQIVTGHLNLIK